MSPFERQLIVLVVGLSAACGTPRIQAAPEQDAPAGDVPVGFAPTDAVADGPGQSEDAADDQAGAPRSDAPPCEPDCAGRACGDDGCGGSCGQCDDGDPCTTDDCTNGGCQSSPEPGPCSWPGNWHFEALNPVLAPVPGVPSQGADNVYAPDVIRFGNQWWMYYGAQGDDGHDAVFLARSNDLVHWTRHPSDSDPQPVVDHGGSNHVNDPSVVQVGGTLYMYYTEAPTGEEDRIHLATSADGLDWAKQGMVLDVGPAGSWEPDRVGRPSVLHEGGQFRMWYDGQVYGVARHVGYATSDDGYTWTKHAGNPILEHHGAVDVDRVGDWYVLLSEGHSGTHLFVAKDPLSWHPRGLIWSNSGQPWDQFGQVTPFLLTAGGKAVAVFFGGASDGCWCKNRIAVAWPTEDTCEPTCLGVHCGSDGCGGSCGTCGAGMSCIEGKCEGGFEGCTGCISGAASCDAWCKAEGQKGGSCAHPGSTDTGQCCDCDNWACEKCVGDYSSCEDACQQAGHPGGHCAAPNSTDPLECCACDPDTGCEGCLVGAASCMEACQGAGMSYGWCGSPGSQDPSACCACQ